MTGLGRRAALAVGCVGMMMAAGLGAAQAAEHAVHWGYKGEAGPAHWGRLAEDFAACGEGRMQSPIDLAKTTIAADVAVDVAYQPVPLTVVNNGHTLMIPAEGGGRLTAGGVTYDLLQFHFHTPSEHVLDGKPAVAEGHFVHKAADGSLAVLGVLYRKGANNPALATIGRHAPKADETETTTLTIDPAALLPADRGVIHYMGSLTTPPCTEGVHWFVLDTPVTLDNKTLRVLSKRMGHNARPAQEINNRLVIAPVE